jgi:RHS repeat-associated protein
MWNPTTTRRIADAPKAPLTCTVTALFITDIPRVASATVMVSTTATAVVTVSPGQAAVASSGTATFSASVQCSANTAVSWSCSGGNIDQAGHYTAPATGGIYTVPATSQAASGAVGAATVTVESGSGAGGTTNATYQYDLDGNLVSGRARTFEWDAENRLVSVTITATGHVTQFGYDGMGRRVQIQELDLDTTKTLQVTSDKKYLWDGVEIAEERDTTGAIVQRRFYSQGFVDTDGAILFYTRDHLGSIRELTDGTQAIRARYDYDPWGRMTKIQGDKDSPFTYTGHFWHAQSGLDLTLFRAYDPNLGRWISRDPINDPKVLRDRFTGPSLLMSFTPAELSQGPSLYGYCLNNTVNDIDKLGLSCSLAGWKTNRDGYSNWDTQMDISNLPMGDGIGLVTLLCDVVIVDHWEQYTAHTTQHLVCTGSCGNTYDKYQDSPAQTVTHVIDTWVQVQDCKGISGGPWRIAPHVGPGPTPPRSGFPM